MLSAAALCVGGVAVASAAPNLPDPGGSLGPTGPLGSVSPGSGSVDLGNGVNPVVLPVAADPSVVRAPDGSYYLYATSDDWQDGGGMHYMPIFHSTDLVNWSHVGDVLQGQPGWTDAGGGPWAPDVHLVNGKYVIYYTVAGTSDPCIGMVTSDSPTGPFTDLGHPVVCSSDGLGEAIDAYVSYDGATPTMFVGNFEGIYAIPLNAEGTAPSGEESVHVAGDGYEAPFIQKHEGMYYMYVSAGNCCTGAASDYRVYVGRSENLMGPYADSTGKPMLEGGGDKIMSGNVTWIGPGHNTVITDDAGTDWMIYHAAPRDAPRLGTGPQNREGMIDKISWIDGWPHVGDGTPSSTAPDAPVVNGQGSVSGSPGSA